MSDRIPMPFLTRPKRRRAARLSIASEHIEWCKRQGLAPWEVLDALGEGGPGDWGDVFLALQRALSILEAPNVTRLPRRRAA